MSWNELDRPKNFRADKCSSGCRIRLRIKLRQESYIEAQVDAVGKGHHQIDTNLFITADVRVEEKASKTSHIIWYKYDSMGRHISRDWLGIEESSQTKYG